MIVQSQKILNFIGFFNGFGSSLSGIAIAPFGFVRDKENQRIVTHEKIHLIQQTECILVSLLIAGIVYVTHPNDLTLGVLISAYFWHYILYGLMYLTNLPIYEDSFIAYCAIPFEQEAYTNEYNPKYILTRPYFAWLKPEYWKT